MNCGAAALWQRSIQAPYQPSKSHWPTQRRDDAEWAVPTWALPMWPVPTHRSTYAPADHTASCTLTSHMDNAVASRLRSAPPRFEAEAVSGRRQAAAARPFEAGGRTALKIHSYLSR